MPDNVEKVVYQVENQQAIDAAKKQTKALEEMGKAAEDAGKKTKEGFEGTVRGIDRTALAIERAASAHERAMRSAGLTAVQSAKLQEEFALRKVKGDTEAEARVRASTQFRVKQLENEEQLNTLRKRAVEASRHQKEHEDQFQKALERTNRAIAANKKAIEDEAKAVAEAKRKEIAAAEEAAHAFARTVRRAGMTPAERLREERAVRGLGLAPEAAERLRAQTEPQIRAMERQEEFNRMLKRAQDASKRAAEQTDAFTEALRRNQKASEGTKKALADQEQETKKLAETTRNIVERAQYRTAGAVGRIQMERMQALRLIDPKDTAAAAELNKHFDTLVRNQQRSDAIARRNELSTSLRGAADSAQFFATRLVALGATVLGGLVYLTKQAAAFERTQIAFENLLGSKAKGDAFFNSLIEYSKKSVFGLQEITKSAQQAIALGFSPEQAQKVVQASNAVSAAMGGQAELANRITLALGQMQAKQRVSAEEMRQLSEAGVAGWEMLAKAAGKTVPEMMKLAEKGMLDANVAVQILTDGILRRFGAVEEAMRRNTLAGKMADIRQQVDLLALEFQSSLLPIGKQVLDWAIKLTKALGEFAKGFDRLPDGIKSTAGAMTIATAAGAGLLLLLSQIALGLSSLLALLDAFGAKSAIIAGLKGAWAAGAGLGTIFGLSFGGAALAGIIEYFRQTERLDQQWQAMARKTMPDTNAALKELEENYNKQKAAAQGNIDKIKELDEAYKALRETILTMPSGREVWTAPGEKPEMFGKFTPEQMAQKNREMWARMRTDQKKTQEEAAASELDDFFSAEKSKLKVTILGSKESKLVRDKADEESAEEAKRRAKEVAQAEEQARRLRQQAEEKAAEGFRKNTLDYIENVRLYGKSAVAVAELRRRHEALNLKTIEAMWEDYRKRTMKKADEDFDRRWKQVTQLTEDFTNEQRAQDEARDARRGEVFKQAVEQQSQLEQLREQETADRIQHERDVALAQLDMQRSMGDLNVQQKAALEEKKYQIEVEYAAKAAELEVEKLRKAYHAQYARIELLVRTGDLSIEEGYQKMAAAEQVFRENAEKIAGTMEREIAKKRIDTTTQTNEIIYQDYRQTFERIRSSASSLLDQLFSKTRSWGDILKSILQAAILTPLKEIAATWIAITLTGGRGAPAPRGTRAGGGFFGQLFNLGSVFGGGGGGGGYYGAGSGGGAGMAPYIFSFGGGGRGGAGTAWGGSRATAAGLGWMGSLGRLFGMGAPAATSAAALPLGAGRLGDLVLQDAAMRAGVTLPAAGTPGFGASALGPMAGIAAALGGLQLGTAGVKRGGLLGGLMGIGGFAMTGASLSMLGKVLPQLAKFGGWTGAGIGAGAGLMAAGWQKGGGLGALMAIGGGALAGGSIGLKVGGPIGALIGAAIGAGVGGIGSLIGSMRKSAEEKMTEEVRRVYGVTISRDLAKQFVQTAKNNYGGDMRLAVASPEIREMVKLYALSTGQRVGNVPRSMYPVEMAQTGGALHVMPQYEGGAAVASPYVGPTPTTWQPNVFVQLDPQQANQLFEGRVVKVIESNPNAVSNASTTATESGYNRNAGRAASQEPLTTMA